MSEIQIKDLKMVITEMHPIEIIIDGVSVWNDDVDLTNMSCREIDTALSTNEKQYWDVVSRTQIVNSISFKIVSYHHSIVNITTYE